MAEPIVKTTALKKHYKTGSQLVKALDGVDFEVKEREFVAIIGKSGSGKTTLLHMLGGLDTPTSGSVTVGGTALETLDNDRLAVFRRRKVGFIFQQYNLIPDLNVYDNILFPLELDGARIDRKFIDYLLETLHIPDKKEMLPSMLSGGEQQRVAIIRALAARPAIILADEISPDTCRYWDIETHDHLDKDRFRRDLGDAEGAYQEVYRRLGLDR